MKNLNLLISVLVSSFASGCAMKVGMVSPTPRVAGIDACAAKLHVLIDDSIKNDLEVKSADLKTAHIKDFRKSLQEGFKSAFSGAFDSVEFVDTKVPEGYLLHLEKVDPKHVILDTITQGGISYVPGVVVKGQYIPGFVQDTSSTTVQVGIKMTWHAALHLDGKRMRVSQGQLMSDDKTQSIRGVNLVMKNALDMLLENIGKDLFQAQIASR